MVEIIYHTLSKDIAIPLLNGRGGKETMNNNFIKAKEIESQNKKRLLEVNPDLDEKSGIYFLLRKDENGFRYAYIGQAKHILTRLAQHLSGYDQHIDKSLKSHGLFSADNNWGWQVYALHFPLEELNEKEQYYIKKYADAGWQLRNKTAGGQGEGKAQINEYRPSKGYRDGIQQGKKMLARELKHIRDKHLVVSLKPEKSANKVSQNALEKFNQLLDENNYKSEVSEDE
jgi:hypothetical protein